MNKSRWISRFPPKNTGPEIRQHNQRLLAVLTRFLLANFGMTLKIEQ